MSFHQIIYTSCMRGINGVNDGQQVYSYDRDCKEANSDEVKSLFSYQAPSLSPGVLMTEEIALTMPRSYTFRRLENGTCALVLNTYLGRDYMGSAGRFGNHLSHVILCDAADFTAYPCEFYASPTLRTHMEYEEVNNPERPDYLPVPVLEKGFASDIHSVVEFLSADDRIEIYKNMLCAMLAFESKRKRLVICDKAEHVILWIAALEYAIPLKNALQINFTTYEYDPSLSASRICGVVPEGTRFDADSARLHFVFNLLEGSCPEFQKEADFYDFIETAMTFSYEAMQDFHNFLCSGYHYEASDELLYSAYDLYTLLSDGLKSAVLDRVKRALAFAEDFAEPSEILRIIDRFLEQGEELLQVDRETFLCIAEFISSHQSDLDEEHQSAQKTCFVNRILREFLNEVTAQRDFTAFYNQIDQICRRGGFSIASELMHEEHQKSLFLVMQNRISTWKIAFIVHVVSTHVKDQGLSTDALLSDAPLGRIYYGLVQAVYSESTENGAFLVQTILNEFVDECRYLVNMALNLEGMLLDLPEDLQAAEAMWNYFHQQMRSRGEADFQIANSIFSECSRFDQIFSLYALLMEDGSTCEDCQRIFKRHFSDFVLKNDAYAAEYRERILSLYNSALKRFPARTIKDLQMELFHLLLVRRWDTDFSMDLIAEILRFVPLRCPSKEDAQFIQDAYQYLYDLKKRPIAGKLLLLLIGMALEAVKISGELQENLLHIRTVAHGKRASLTQLPERIALGYFEWILPLIREICQSCNEMAAVYELFEMGPNISEIFFTEAAKLYLKLEKGEKTYEVFCEYLDLVFPRSTARIRQEIGKSLCKLGRSKLSELDREVRRHYASDPRALQNWNEMKHVAESTNPILNNISNFFKRRRDSE